MRRADAIRAMDHLAGAGYTCSITAVPMGDYVIPGQEGEKANYNVSLSTFTYDAVDLRALIELCEDIGLEFMYSSFGDKGHMRVVHPDERPKSNVAHTPRKHPLLQAVRDDD